MPEQFADHIVRERERLNAEREHVFNQQRELEQKLDAINREFAAIDAYETAKAGKAAGRGRSGGPRTTSRRGSRRESILRVLRDNPGLLRGELLEKMGLKGNKQGEMSISNALTALTKAAQIRRQDGKYRAA